MQERYAESIAYVNNISGNSVTNNQLRVERARRERAVDAVGGQPDQRRDARAGVEVGPRRERRPARHERDAVPRRRAVVREAAQKRKTALLRLVGVTGAPPGARRRRHARKQAVRGEKVGGGRALFIPDPGGAGIGGRRRGIDPGAALQAQRCDMP